MKHVLIIFLVFNSWRCMAQAELADTTSPAGLLIMYEFGAYFDAGTDCEKEIRAYYGYRTAWGTCIASARNLRNNKRVNRKIRRRYGRQWHEDYATEVSKCQKVNQSKNESK